MIIIIAGLLSSIIILIYFILDFYYNYIYIYNNHLFSQDSNFKKDYELIVKNLMNATIHEKRIKHKKCFKLLIN